MKGVVLIDPLATNYPVNTMLGTKEVSTTNPHATS